MSSCLVSRLLRIQAATNWSLGSEVKLCPSMTGSLCGSTTPPISPGEQVHQVWASDPGFRPWESRSDSPAASVLSSGGDAFMPDPLGKVNWLFVRQHDSPHQSG